MEIDDGLKACSKNAPRTQDHEIDPVLVSKTLASKAGQRVVFKVLTNTGATSWYGDLFPQLKERSSIDAARNDDGFLGGCFAAYSHCFGNTPMSHNSDCFQ